MKKALLVVGVVLMVRTAAAGVEYDFRQTIHSDFEAVPSSDFSGHAVIEGDRSRVDFLGGTAFPPGTYVILTGGARKQTWVDPSKNSYVEINSGSVAAAIGASRLVISNKKIHVEQLPDQPVIAGIPTTHYKLTLNYDITVPFGQIQLKQSVVTVIDKWTTMAYEGIVDSFLAGGVMKTGNPDVDSLVDAENTGIKGFALKQIMTVNTVDDMPQMPGTQLPIKRNRTQTRELTITAIQAKLDVPATAFLVPAGYHKADPLRDDSQKSPLHVLSMEPAGQ